MSTAVRLYVTKNDLPETTRTRVVRLCNALLANGIDLQSQAKQAHWNVKGPEFSTLHRLFDAISEAIEEYVDLTAERVVQVGGIAEGTARLAVAASELPEYPHDIGSGNEHMKALSTALAAYGQSARAAIDHADELADRDTADIFTQISRGVDKWLWFVEAHLQVSTAP